MTGFIDSNIIVYAFSEDVRAEKARSLLPGAAISVQCLNEFVNVATRKMGFGWPELLAALAHVERLCRPPVQIDLPLHKAGLGIMRRYKLSVYDSLVIAAALRADCATFWSEDMQDGLVIEGRLTIRNPFA